MSKKQLTLEEKYSKQLEDILLDVRADLDLLGLYFYQFARRLAYNRLEALLDVIRDEVYTDKRDKQQRALERMWQDN